MKNLTAVFLMMISFVIAASAQTATKAEPVLHVEVENGKTLDLKAADLAKLTRREIKAKGHDEKDSVYGGYNLSDILLLANAKLATGEMRGKQLAAYVLVEAADGYKVTFAIAELAPEFTDKVVVLADTRDGKPLDEKDGAWQIIVPDEKKHGRWVRQVIRLSVKAVETNKIAGTANNTSSDEELIQEIIFKKIVAPWSSNSDKTLKAYYLSYADSDPSDNIIKKITGLDRPLKKVSESYLSTADGDTVLDKKTKEQGVLFSISKIEWKNNNEVTLTAGSYIANMGSDGCSYTLKKENGQWKISLAENCYVS